MNGAGTTDILVGMVKGIGFVPVEFVQAIASGDPERIGAATFNAGLLAYGAYKAIGGIRGAVEARLGSTSEEALTLTKEIKVRKEPGVDRAISRHIIEKQGEDTISVTHQVEDKSGRIIHQHQIHIGKHGTQRRFPDEWVEYPEIKR